MKDHALPWRRDGARIVRKDGVAIIEGWSHHDPSCRGCCCGAKTMALTESADYAVDCANALAGVPHPERLPGLMEAVRFVLDDVTRQALGDDTLPQVMAAVNDLRRAYAAMMGEKP